MAAQRRESLSAMDEVSRRGLAIYESKLKVALEPKHAGQFVAIHVDSEEYAVSRFSGEAVRALLVGRPADGRIVVIRIGSEPELGLAARLAVGEASASFRSSQ